MINLNRLLSKIEDIDQKAYRYSLQLLNKGMIVSIPNDVFLLNNRSLNLEYKFQKKEMFSGLISLDQIKEITFKNNDFAIRRNQLINNKILFNLDKIEITLLSQRKSFVNVFIKLKAKGPDRIAAEKHDDIFCSEDYFEEFIQYSSLVYYEDENLELNKSFEDFKNYFFNLKARYV